MKIAFFDCFSGISGDMIIGSLLDIGLDINFVSNELQKLDLPGFKLSCDKVKRCHIAGTKLNITFDTANDKLHSVHRNFDNISTLINESDLNSIIKLKSIEIFKRLAQAEAKVHNVSVNDVHFHEVGAADSIIDIVGAVIGFNKLGFEKVLFSPVATGSGYIDCDHGRLPVPAPATAELLKGFCFFNTKVKSELATPTGVAILTTSGEQIVYVPEFKVSNIGYGAGEKDNPEMPNLLRVYTGEANSIDNKACKPDNSDEMWVVETNIDDMSGEMFGYVIDKLLEAGAVDAYMTPIQMKKSRPAVLVSAIVTEENLPDVESVFFKESTTFGIRKYKVFRNTLFREMKTVETEYGTIKIKIGSLNGKIENITPEYEDCRRVAKEKGIALKHVFNAVVKSAFDRK